MAGRSKKSETADQLNLEVNQLTGEGDAPGVGHNSAADRTATESAQMLRSYVARIEALDAELDDLKGDRKEVFSEAKASGFNTKVLAIVIRRRKRKRAEMDEEQAEIDMYEDQLRG